MEGVKIKGNYSSAYYQGWKDLKERDFEAVSRIRDVEYEKDSNIFKLNIFNDDYILDCNNEEIYNVKTLDYIDISLAIPLLSYLSFSNEDVSIEYKWVSLKELPDGGALFYPAFYKSSIKALINKFGYNSNDFLVKTLDLGGYKYNFGDASVIFNIFPKVPICIVIWEGDDEVSPSATMLLDKSVSRIVHIESIIGILMFVVDKIADFNI